jgi:cytochrome c oxidase cbb3-type subunit 3
MATEEKYDQETIDSKLMIDHDYDGIKELDNPPPPWLMMIFYGTIIWSVFYVFYYHVFDGPSQEDEYNTEMAEAKANMPKSVFDENNIVLLTDAASLAEGEKLFASKACDACHGVTNIGPDLTDNYWIHGNQVGEVFKVIKYGVAEKGMTPFKGQMTDEQMQQVTSYILVNMKGAATANTKGPQGDKYE